MPVPEITTPQFLHLTVNGTAERPAVTIRAVHKKALGCYVNASVSVEHPMLAVTPTRLAKMRLGALRREALRTSLAEANPELSRLAPVKSFFKGTTGRTVAERARLAPTNEHLENAALIYRLAKLVGDFPIQAVARSFGLERDDAARWVAVARKRALLT